MTLVRCSVAGSRVEADTEGHHDRDVLNSRATVTAIALVRRSYEAAATRSANNEEVLSMSEGFVSRGFMGRRRTEGGDRLPPGQYLVDGFPVLSAGPTPHTP
jgi:hypothetical protein